MKRELAPGAGAVASGPRELPERLVLYDGAVRWLPERDPAGRLCFAPLQGETTAWLRRLPRNPAMSDQV